MAEPLDVELLLRRTAAAIDVSGADRVLAALTPRLAAEGRTAESRKEASAWPRRRWLAVAAALLLVATVLVASPGTRQAVARFFGLPGVEIVRFDDLPAGIGAVGLPDLDVGAPTTLAAARDRLGYQPRMFDDRLGPPDGVYLDGSALSYVYRPRPGLPETTIGGVGLLLTQFDGLTNDNIVKKVTVSDTEVEEVSVAGRPGLWIEGEHAVAYLSATDDLVEVPVRLSGNVLMWQDGDVTVRLEANLTREQAIALAATLSR